MNVTVILTDRPDQGLRCQAPTDPFVDRQIERAILREVEPKALFETLGYIKVREKIHKILLLATYYRSRTYVEACLKIHPDYASRKHYLDRFHRKAVSISTVISGPEDLLIDCLNGQLRIKDYHEWNISRCIDYGSINEELVNVCCSLSRYHRVGLARCLVIIFVRAREYRSSWPERFFNQHPEASGKSLDDYRQTLAKCDRLCRLVVQNYLDYYPDQQPLTVLSEATTVSFFGLALEKLGERTTITDLVTAYLRIKDNPYRQNSKPHRRFRQLVLDSATNRRTKLTFRLMTLLSFWP